MLYCKNNMLFFLNCPLLQHLYSPPGWNTALSAGLFKACLLKSPNWSGRPEQAQPTLSRKALLECSLGRGDCIVVTSHPCRGPDSSFKAAGSEYGLHTFFSMDLAFWYFYNIYTAPRLVFRFWKRHRCLAFCSMGELKGQRVFIAFSESTVTRTVTFSVFMAHRLASSCLFVHSALGKQHNYSFRFVFRPNIHSHLALISVFTNSWGLLSR